MTPLRLLPAALLLAAALAQAACGGPDEADATPRRRGYPRLPAYDSCYVVAPGAALPLEVNAAATVADSCAGRWLTVGYPLHNSLIYITITRAATPDELSRALDNRRERIGLNLGGAEASTAHLSSPAGFEAALVEAPGSGTPLQFVATDGRATMVSGAARIDVAADAPYDSIRPIVATLRRDIVHMLTTLRLKP